jgi:hypothetical protein
MIGEFKNSNFPGIPYGIHTDPNNGFTTIYTAPAGKASYIIQLDIASTGNTGVQISVRVVDASAANSALLVKNAPVPVGSAIQIIDGQKVVLEEGDKLEVRCDTSGETVDAICSLVEDVNG